MSVGRTKRSLTSLVVCTCMLVLAANIQLASARSATSEIRDVFDDFRKAILNDRGEKAADLVTSATLDYFARMQEFALYGSPAEVVRQPLADQMQILTYRHEIEPAMLLAVTPHELLVYLVDNDLIDKTSVKKTDSGKITVQGSVATVGVRRKKDPTGINFHFYRENGRWLIDFVEIIAMGTPVLKRLAIEKNLPEQLVVTSYIATRSGRSVSISVWVPPYVRGEK